MQEQGIIRIEYDEILRNSMDTSDIPAENQMLLTQEQEIAVQQIREEWEKQSPRPVLIEGVTGSGKTHTFADICKDDNIKVLVILPLQSNVEQFVKDFPWFWGAWGKKSINKIMKKKAFFHYKKAFLLKL